MWSARHLADLALSATGFLYEGNFNAGQKEVSAMFVAQGHPAQACPSFAAISKEDGRPTYYAGDIDDLQNILARISPELKARVPLNIEAKVGVLYARLEKLCQPFRLFDLPAELRVQIYGEVGGESDQTIHIQHGHKKAGTPPLVQTSQQLGHEVIPVCVSNTTCHADCSEPNKHISRKFLTSWEVAWSTPWFKLLKHFKLSLMAGVPVITGYDGVP